MRQEGALGIILAERRLPGDRDNARREARRRIARWRKRERDYHVRAVPILIEPGHPAEQFERVLLREILDLLPLARRKSVLLALLTGDGRHVRRAAREVRETIPALAR